MTSVKQQS